MQTKAFDDDCDSTNVYVGRLFGRGGERICAKHCFRESFVYSTVWYVLQNYQALSYSSARTVRCV